MASNNYILSYLSEEHENKVKTQENFKQERG